MGLGVVDGGVVVHVLFAGSEGEAVQGGFGSLAIQDRIDVIADQGPAQGNGMGGHGGATSELKLQGGDMKGPEAFLLQLVVLDYCPFPGHQLGHRIGEVKGVGPARIGFHDAGLAVGAGQHQAARIENHRFPFPSRVEMQVNRLFHDGVPGKMDQGEILQERRIQGGEDFFPVSGIETQRLPDGRGFPVEELPRSLNPDTRRQLAERRVFRREASVQEYQPAGRRVGSRQGVQVNRGGPGIRSAGMSKGGPRQRREAGKTPGLIVSGRESVPGEASDRRLALLSQPGRVAVRPAARKRVELGQVALLLGGQFNQVSIHGCLSAGVTAT